MPFEDFSQSSIASSPSRPSFVFGEPYSGLSSYCSTIKDHLSSAWTASVDFFHDRCPTPPKWLIVALAIPTTYYTVRYIWELVRVDDLKNKVIFVTGCDHGFGHMLSVKCAREAGMTVFAGCLTEKGRLAIAEEDRKLQQEGTKEGGGRIIEVPLDVTDEDSCMAAARFVERNLKQGQYLWALVNNAGIFSWYGPDTWCDVEKEYRLAMDVNAFGMIRCVHAFLPLIKRSGRGGRIVSASSVLGRIANAFGAPYSMAKYAVQAYMDTIRQELRPWGITCCILEPSGFATNLLSIPQIYERVEIVWARLPEEMKEEYGEDYKKLVTKVFLSVAEGASSQYHHVVDNYYHAVAGRWPRLRYRCGWPAIFVHIPVSFLPTEVEDFILRCITGCHLVDPAALKRQKERRE